MFAWHIWGEQNKRFKESKRRPTWVVTNIDLSFQSAEKIQAGRRGHEATKSASIVVQQPVMARASLICCINCKTF